MSTGHCLHQDCAPACCRCGHNTITTLGMTVQAWEVCQKTPTNMALHLSKLPFDQVAQAVLTMHNPTNIL
jgi:hypothetical protein